MINFGSCYMRHKTMLPGDGGTWRVMIDYKFNTLKYNYELFTIR